MHRTKRLAFVSFVFLVVAASLTMAAQDAAEQSPAPAIRPLPVGAAAPAVTVRTEDGKPFDLHAAIMAKPTVLMFVRGWW